MDRRKFLTAVAGATSAVLAGCGGGDSGPTATPTQSGEVVATFEITRGGIQPLTHSIEVGQAVEWVNQTGADRRIEAVPNSDVTGEVQDWTFGPPQVLSSNANTVTRNWAQPDQTITRTFNEPGVYVFEDSQLTLFQGCGAVVVGEEASMDGINLPCDFQFGGGGGGGGDDNSS